MDLHSDQHALIVLGGHPPQREILKHLPTSSFVVCADSGLDHALALDLQPHVVIGDFDSASADAVEQARASGSTLIPFDRRKDQTDAELALHYVLEHRFSDVTVLWGGGDRIDHVLGVMAALAHPRLSALNTLTAWVGRDQLQVLHAHTAIDVHRVIGTTISLLPLGATPARLTTTGLHWELIDEELDGRAARGVSNVVRQSPTQITVQQGVLAVITPDALNPHALLTTNIDHK